MTLVVFGSGVGIVVVPLTLLLESVDVYVNVCGVHANLEAGLNCIEI